MNARALFRPERVGEDNPAVWIVINLGEQPTHRVHQRWVLRGEQARLLLVDPTGTTMS